LVKEKKPKGEFFVNVLIQEDAEAMETNPQNGSLLTGLGQTTSRTELRGYDALFECPPDAKDKIETKKDMLVVLGPHIGRFWKD